MYPQKVNQVFVTTLGQHQKQEGAGGEGKGKGGEGVGRGHFLGILYVRKTDNHYANV